MEVKPRKAKKTGVQALRDYWGIDTQQRLAFTQKKAGGDMAIPFYVPAPDFAEPDGNLKVAISHAL